MSKLTDATHAHKAPASLSRTYVKRRYTFQKQFKQERPYLIFLLLAFMAAALLAPYPHLAMWFGFCMAAYSTIANDSIQTVGTFIQSNRHRRWWVLWLFIGGVFVATVTYSWFTHNGDVSYERLASKGFDTAPTSFSFLQLAAPVFLLILTRLRMPVSTSILILSSFSTDPDGVGAMLTKSLSGYIVAFVAAIAVWALVSKTMERNARTPAHSFWMPAQWVATAFLWSSWIMQDASNIAVYLPRSLSAGQFLFFAGFVFFGLGVLFYLRGDRIQRVVSEKTDVADIRSATVIDLVYGIILFVFKEMSKIPMSTTWVFIGLLAGREIAITLFGNGEKRTMRETLRLAGKDVLFAAIGLIVSIAIAAGVNPEIVLELFR
jgi:hypothetical protein